MMKMKLAGKWLAGILLLSILMGCGVSSNMVTGENPTGTVEVTDIPIVTPTQDALPDDYVEYYTQSGDTLAAVAAHFGVEAKVILFPDGVVEDLLLPPETRLFIPDVLGKTTPHELLIPDSDIVYSPSTIGFDALAFVDEQDGKLADYSELMTAGTTPGAQILNQIAIEAPQGEASGTQFDHQFA